MQRAVYPWFYARKLHSVTVIVGNSGMLDGDVLCNAFSTSWAAGHLICVVMCGLFGAGSSVQFAIQHHVS
ncbi:hypothetical protein [Vibrio cyclitrophicus]|uniref:hypothetical protein n=1 Tax=Vibrio cyclitrophicus TaxID=47951 RepID=UPI001054C088|nr:hypothetical protein [Vibrio cyclitrophicus]